MTDANRLRQYLSKASFASEGDRHSALECLRAIEQAAVDATATMPGNVPLSDQLGLAPEPDFLLGCEDGGAVRCYYECTVMRLLASERERLAKLCDQVINAVETGRGHAVGAAKCALAIRGA